MDQKDEFIALLDRYAFTHKSAGLILDRKPATIHSWVQGRLPVPPDKLAMLRKIVAAIDAARGV